MPVVAKLHGIQGPGGLVPTETLIHFAVNIPYLRAEVIKALEAGGHLARVGLAPLPWYVRLWRRLFSRTPALPQGT